MEAIRIALKIKEYLIVGVLPARRSVCFINWRYDGVSPLCPGSCRGGSRKPNVINSARLVPTAPASSAACAPNT